MTINKDFAKSIGVFLIFIVGLIIIVSVRKCADVKEPTFAVKKVSFIYKKPVDLNLTKLDNRKRLYYEELID